MTKAEVYTFDLESLRDRSTSQIFDLVESLIDIIKEQDQVIQIQDELIKSAEDDGK